MICLGSQLPGWLNSTRCLCAPLGAWPFGLLSSNGIGASTSLASAPCRPLRSTRLGLARQAAHRSISVTLPALSGGEKAGGVGETPPGESSAALDDNRTENQTSPEGPSASQHNSEGLVPTKVKLSEMQQPPLDNMGSSCSGAVPSTRHWARKELYTTEALEARERYTGLTLIQRRRVEDALSRGELLDPPAFKQRYGPPGFLVADNRHIAGSSQSTEDQVIVSPGEDVGQPHKVGAPNVSATAQSYLECCSAAFSKETLAEASGLGSTLLLETGSLESAVHALQEVRLLRHGDLLAAAVNGQIEGVSRLHAEYLKEMAELGVPSRRSDLPVRVEAHNHGSVHGYEEELLSKAWKDAAYGAVLLVDPSRAGVAEILESSRVAESPLGRVPKQNPDRTISSEGRPINDMRLQNSKGSKFNHPPAPQPRHQSVARQSLWWHARHPGVPQRCAKRDVPRAFK